MFRAITKIDFWRGLDVCPKLDASMGLKHVQDITILSYLLDSNNLRILEAGGGNSRLLDFLCENNECWNVDAMEGLGNGELEIRSEQPIRQVKSYIGNYDRILPASSFDVVFSVSVLEHILEEDLGDFFRDCARLLKPGGLMFHAVDMYLPERDDPTPFNASIRHIEKIKGCLDGMDEVLAWIDPEAVDSPKFASPAFASNSDIVLWSWNRAVPKLAEIRAKSQSCSLVIGMRRKRGKT